MHYHTIATNDIDELFSWGDGWDQRYLQLSAGPLGFQTRVVSLPDLIIEWNSLEQRVLFEEALGESALVFGMLLPESSPVQYRGRDMTPAEGVVFHPGHEQEYVARPGCRSLMIIAAPRLARALGLKLAPHRVQSISQPLASKLLTTCRTITAMAARQSEPSPDPQLDAAIRDRVLADLSSVLAPWMGGQGKESGTFECPTRAFSIVKNAQELLAEWHADRKLDVSQVAAELDLSQRALYDSFRQVLGMGPYEFHLLRKMHVFREALLDGDPFHGKIQQAARAAGFQHLGRLTEFYRRQFGESPRDTLKRRSGSGGS